MAKKNRVKTQQDSKIVESLGSVLKRARQEKKLSVEELHTKTRIPLVTLTQLESDSLEALPAPVYVRGFIKLYCREVGLEYDTVVALYPQKSAPLTGSTSSTPNPVISALASIKGEEQPKEERESRVSTALVVFILLILATLTISYFSSQKENTSSSSSPSAQEAAHFDVTG